MPWINIRVPVLAVIVLDGTNYKAGSEYSRVSGEGETGGGKVFTLRVYAGAVKTSPEQSLVRRLCL